MWAHPCSLPVCVPSLLEQSRECEKVEELVLADHGGRVSAYGEMSVCMPWNNISPQTERFDLHKETNRFQVFNDTDEGRSTLYAPIVAPPQTDDHHSELEIERLKRDALNISVDLPFVEEVTRGLQRCRKLKSPAEAKQAHAHACFHGLDLIGSIQNHLVPLFVDCGCISEAHQIFHRSRHKSEHSWTALMFASIGREDMQAAFDLHAAMKGTCIPPSAHTILALLKACIKLGNVQKGQKVYTEAVEWGLEEDAAVSSSIVDMYAKFGLLSEASYVLSASPNTNVISWTALIGGYADYGHGKEAISEFAKMQFEGVAPNAVTIACVLKALDSVTARDSMGELVRKIKGTCLEGDPLVGNTLVGKYAKLGFIGEAQDIFNNLENPTIVSWNAFISGLVENGAATEAMTRYKEMLRHSVPPNAVTFTSVCKACGELGAVEMAQCVHMEIIKFGLEGDYFVGNSLSCMYAKCNLLMEAVEVFDKLLVKDVVSWSALIGGYAKKGPGSEGLKYFEQMKLNGVLPNAFTFTSVVRACVSIQALDIGRDIHMEIEAKGYANNVHIGNALVSLYAKCGSLAEAQYVFNKLPSRDVLSWNSLITGYAEHGPGQEALKCFWEMQTLGLQLDVVSFAGALKACGALGAFGSGRNIHERLAESPLALDPCIGNSLINMYAKCGSLLDAQEVFDKLPVRDVVVWSSMIQACGMNHEGQKAIDYFEDMQRQGVKANDVTFTCLLSACSHASLPKEGSMYFKAMRQDYGVVPSVEHYNCMIDLFARSGHLLEAERLCELVGFSSEGALSALLTAGRICSEVDLGIRCFQQIANIKADDAGLYVIMTDILASAGRQDDACRVEHLRRHLELFKKPATAILEVGKEVYEFTVGSNQSRRIMETLNSLNDGMKAEGNVAHLEAKSRGSSDREKEESLCEHAEKIAIAFGLLNTREGQTLRITKNLRMCRECHNASMFISKERRREIVIRDNCCVHHFKDGFCSCGDMF